MVSRSLMGKHGTKIWPRSFFFHSLSNALQTSYASILNPNWRETRKEERKTFLAFHFFVKLSREFPDWQLKAQIMQLYGRKCTVSPDTRGVVYKPAPVSHPGEQSVMEQHVAGGTGAVSEFKIIGKTKVIFLLQMNFSISFYAIQSIF